jgi:hypothetical protein
MTALLTRNRPASAPASEVSAPAIAALIANVQTTADEMRGDVSHRQFRQTVRDRGRSCNQAWAPIRSAALSRW